MLSRVAFTIIAIFWVIMNVLLWRSEYRPEDALGSEIPVQTVLWKILTAPDNSQLEVRQHGKTIGFCRWSPEVLATKATEAQAEALGIEDMVTRLKNYHLAAEGNVSLSQITNRLRFQFDAILDTNRTWQEFRLQLSLRPNNWEFHASAAEKILHVNLEDGSDTITHDFTFADLANPEALLREFIGQIPSAWLISAGLPLEASQTFPPIQLGLTWQAHEATLKLGHSVLRVYRLETRLLDHYPIIIFVSRAGEILRVDLPNDVRLTNDQLAAP